MANAGELLDKWVSTFNESNWDESEQLFAPNGVTEEIGTGRTVGVERRHRERESLESGISGRAR